MNLCNLNPYCSRVNYTFNKYLLSIYYVLSIVLDAWDASVDKTDKGARFSNMIIQKLEKRDAVGQLDIWKKVSQSKTKEKKKKAIRRQVRLRQSEQDKQLEKTYQSGRRVRRSQRRASRWQKIIWAMLTIIKKLLDFILFQMRSYCTALSREVTWSNSGFGRITLATKMG